MGNLTLRVQLGPRHNTERPIAGRWLVNTCLLATLSCAERPNSSIEPLPTTWVDPGYYVWPGPWAGLVSLHASTWDYGRPQLTWDFEAYVLLGTPGDDRTTLVQVAVHDPLDGLDDCGLTEEMEGIQNIEPEEPHRWLRAGDVYLELPSGTVWPMYELGRGEYSADLTYYGIQADYGETYTFSATGAAFPAFEVSVDLPKKLVLTEPEPGTPLEGAVPLEWTGSSDGVLEVEIRFHASSGSLSGTFTLTCSLEDDGAYTIPSELVERLPSDADTVAVSWQLNRVTIQEVTLPEGQVLGLVAESVAYLYP
jgi:hypothetical protein